MAADLFWKILLSMMIALSIASNYRNERICTKQILNKFYIHRFDKNIQRVVSDEKIRKTIIFVCCDGYRERSRRKELPHCEPVCKQSCGYGYCYRPNSCACYYGYEISDLSGSCKRIGTETKTVSPTVTDVTLKFESSTWTHIWKKTTDLNKNAVSETTSEKDTKFDHGPTTKQIDFPRVRFITYSDSDLGTMSETSRPGSSLKIESSKKQIDTRPYLETVSDFPRVKFIPHRDSLLNNIKSRNQPSTQTKDLEVHSYVSANCSFGACTCQMGYKLIDDKFCTQCRIGSQCQCRDGYAFDSFRCKPLCNGVFDGCIQGTCIEHDECRCFFGAEKFTNDRFRCYVIEASNVDQRKIDTKWFLLVLLIPALVVVISFYFIIKRSRFAKSNRLKAQRHQFQEIRYFQPTNNLCFQKQNNVNEIGSGLDGPANQLNENILIVKV